jgi:hypothetical protein
MSAESTWLRQNWETGLTEYDREWVAVDAAGVADHDTDLAVLLERTATRGEELLFAFVWLGGVT